VTGDSISLQGAFKVDRLNCPVLWS